MGLLSHQMLQIVKGVGPTPGDTASAEQPLVVLDLIDSGSGISLDLDGGWEPNIPSLKSGGIWADSPISDGRTLIAGVNTNVTETMRLIVSTQNAQVYAALFTALQRMIQDTRAFWDTFYQIEPVYIAWWAGGAPGPQYALIYNIDMDLTFEDSEDANATITLTIEREFGWRGVKPGGNPKEWTLYTRNIPFNKNNADLGNQGTEQQLAQNLSCVNRMTWNAAHDTITAQNYVTIPASAIPGDLPALALINANIGAGGISSDSIFFYRHSKPASILDRVGGTEYLSLMLNAIPDASGVGDPGTDTASQADTGASSGNRLAISFATVATAAKRVTFIISPADYVDNLHRGRYAVFIRARVSVNTTTATLQLRVGERTASSASWSFVGDTISTSDAGAGGTGNTTEWVLYYMGQITIPSSQKASSNLDGRGLDQSYEPIAIWASRTAGAGLLYINDLIFVPIDEPSNLLQLNTSGVSFNGTFAVYDGTAYSTHGDPTDVAQDGIYSSNIFSAGWPMKMSGSTITLKPGVANRIHALTYRDSDKHISALNAFELRVNIVPRWTGIRDV